MTTGSPRPVERVVRSACRLGESPLWHPAQERLYWIDIESGRVHHWAPASSVHGSFSTGERVGAIALHEDGSLLIFGSEGRVRAWRENGFRTVVPRQKSHRGFRYNDALADARGHVLCGVVPLPGHRRAAPNAAGLHRLDPDGRVRIILAGIGLSNGLGFTPDRRHLYHADSVPRTVVRRPYDAGSGIVGEGTSFVRLEPPGTPDGLTVDEEGFVWIAVWGGAAVVRYDPDGIEERRVALPVPNVTSVAFGGSAFEDLYVTTAGGGRNGRAGAGDLYRIRPGVRGVPERRAGPTGMPGCPT